MTDSGFNADDIDTSVPHSARLYDWFLGGKDHYAADVAAAQKIVKLFPGVRETAMTNREFMNRAARFLADHGVTQFLDVGTGIPTEPNLHQIVQSITPSSRVVYVDNDPIVLRHAEALLRGTPEGRTAYIHADVLKPEAILSYAREQLDFSQPIGLSVVALMQFVTDEQDPYQIVNRLLEPMVPGSYLVLSHVTWEFNPEIWDRVDAIYRAGGTPVKARSYKEVAGFFEGLEICEPGVVLSTRWHPNAEMRIRDEQPLYVGVARKQ
ncbi:SAM-dependent methyltransferase [Streptomyces sp. NBC_00696]|uniref:SAM-dependent methyltransferase n=1 Tax=Streptomyces sp. NBC_00696 TaxID=2903672 RepID=UPI002E3445A6|nr:SAM-dependent methyltransferase [Streptomyces sp. NBC_00696]